MTKYNRELFATPGLTLQDIQSALVPIVVEQTERGERS